MKDNITLQINLSPGDVNYAHLTVPSLVKQHPTISQILLIVDCNKPQKTKLIDPDKKYPEPDFSNRVKKIKAIATQLLEDGVVTDIHFVENTDLLIPLIAKKYFNNIVKETHEYGGIGITSYLAGLELSKTRYVLHYDGDMLVHQKTGFDWALEALKIFDQHRDCVSVCPGIAPPTSKDLRKASHEHWSSFERVEGGFKDVFFSARQFIIDKERLALHLPLLKGIALWETLLVKYLNRGYPRAVENVFFKRFRSAGKYRFMMNSEKCWVLHPLNKPEPYLNILPQIIEAVSLGKIPKEQDGHENIKLEAWINFFNANRG